MKKYYIYGLLRGEILFYVGVTTNCAKREVNHKWTYGKDIAFVVLEEYTGSKDTALSLEEVWIKKYLDLGLLLYNKQKNGEKKVTYTFASYLSVIEAAKLKCAREGVTLSEKIDELLTLYTKYDAYSKKTVYFDKMGNVLTKAIVSKRK
jgi:predicted GIY-YIG superfamily endonuclease